MLIAAGTRSEDVFFILSGVVRITIFSADGKEVTFRDQGAGSFFGDLSAIDGQRRSTSAVVVEEGELLVVRGTDFRRCVFGRPEDAEWFAAHLSWQVRSLTERVLEMSTLNVRSRLHCQLLRLAAVAGIQDNAALISPSPTHELLATMIGTHREAVTRELSWLVATGMVEQGRRRLKLVNVERLAGLVHSRPGAD